MGHTYGEMIQEVESSPEDKARFAWLEELRRRGYEGPAQTAYGYEQENHVRAGTRRDAMELFHHLPCGQAIFNPDIHDPLCPAGGE